MLPISIASYHTAVKQNHYQRAGPSLACRRDLMSKSYTYTDAGVNRSQRVEAKKELGSLRETYKHIGFGGIMHLPYSNVLPIGEDRFLDLQIEGVGTKVLVAELADKYDTIGIDAVAMAVNDVIRSGAKPLGLADNIHAVASVPKLVNAWLRGIIAGAEQSECPVVNGETGDVAEIIKGFRSNSGFDMVVSCVGQVEREDLITGRDITPGDVIIGLASSGLHSNGITLARKILFKAWGGKYEPTDVPQELAREIGLEVLEPTQIYVKPLLKLAREIKVKAAVHITGDSYTKFNNLVAFSPGIGFCFDRFDPQPIFGLIQKTASELGYVIADEEMFGTFNMGWGFGVIVDKTDCDTALGVLEQSGYGVERIGMVTGRERVVEIVRGEKRLILA